MKVITLLEAEETAKQAAFRFQQELLDAGAEDADLSQVSYAKYKDATLNNGMTDISRDVSIDVVLSTGDKVNLLLSFRKLIKDWALYDIDTDAWFTEADKALQHLEARFLRLQKEDESYVDESVSGSGPSSSTKLARFAKELAAKGFEAEVSNKAPVGVINSSKLGVKVKGYGIDDFFKLYKPLWKWESTDTCFADCKTEKKFSTVQELVDKLKERYPKLPRCLTFKQPLKEAVASPGLKPRLMKFYQDLIEELPEAEVGPIKAYHIMPRSNDPWVRFVITLTFSREHRIDGFHFVDMAIVINDMNEGGLADVLVMVSSDGGHAKSIDEYDFSKGMLDNNLVIALSHDETQSGIPSFGDDDDDDIIINALKGMKVT